MKKRFSLATVIGLALLVAALTFTITYGAVQRIYNEQLAEEQQTGKRFAKLIKMLDIIQTDFVGNSNEPELMDGAADGVIAATGDRWSFYMDEKSYQEYRSSVANDYAGIGVTVIYDQAAGGLRVGKLHAGSPADTAGLRYRDLIVAVDGGNIVDLINELGYSDAVAKVRGVAGTDVVLTVERDGERMDFTVTRGQYLNNPISSEILDGNIGYIKIENFDSRADVNFADALSKLLGAEVEGLIFDVRDNGGGYKDVMVEMLDMLCPEGILFQMRDKHGSEQIDYSDAEEVDLPMVVLVNEDSYSAAEFFAAALQEYGKAYIVGTNTSGKGYSQVTIELGDGSAMNLSVYEYFTPSGKSLIGVGLDPDYKVPSNYSTNLLLLDHEDDEQLQTAIARVTLDIEQNRAAHPVSPEESGE